MRGARGGGRSGGAHEAVVDGETGYVVEPRDVGAVRAALERAVRRSAPAVAHGSGGARAGPCGEYSYDRLVARLAPIARGDFSATAAPGNGLPRPVSFPADRPGRLTP